MRELFEVYYRDWDEYPAKLMIEVDSECKNRIYLIVEAAKFKGEGCVYMTDDQIRLYSAQLMQMDQTFEGACRIDDSEAEEAFMEVSFKEGKLRVDGLVSDYINKLMFKFDADQTILKELLSVLKKLGKQN